MRMISRNYVLQSIGVLLLSNILLINSQGYDCINPINLWGHCLNIKQCQPLITLLQNYGNVEGVPEFLRNSTCGYENSMPKVCCPPTSLPESSTTSSGSFRSPIQNPEDLSSTTPVPAAETSQYGPLFAPDCGVLAPNITYPRVVNGQPAWLGMWPWMVALGYNSTSYDTFPGWGCGGTLISARHVLTAAHCAYDQPSLYLVRLGDLDLDPNVIDNATAVDILIEKIDIHPQYFYKNNQNDIAVIRLREDVQFTKHIKPACLPISDDIFYKDLSRTMPFVAGWGSVFHRGPTSTRLRQTQLRVRKQEDCEQAFVNRRTGYGMNVPIDNRIICAGYGSSDTCGGDSGGPFVYPLKKVWYVVGVISFGYQCGVPGLPSALTRVTSYLDFIRPLLK